MNNIREEIFKYFIPQTEILSKNKQYFRWERGHESVEIQIPGFKIAKRGKEEKRPWIIASFIYPFRLKSGRGSYKRVTCSFEYEKDQLKSLLNELNR